MCEIRVYAKGIRSECRGIQCVNEGARRRNVGFRYPQIVPNDCRYPKTFEGEATTMKNPRRLLDEGLSLLLSYILRFFLFDNMKGNVSFLIALFVTYCDCIVVIYYCHGHLCSQAKQAMLASSSEGRALFYLSLQSYRFVCRYYR